MHLGDASKKFKVILAWWQDMTEQNYNSVVKPAASTSSCFPAQNSSIDISRENAAIVIQSHFRSFFEHRNFLKKIKALGLIQTVMRAWLNVKKNSELNKFSFAGDQEFPSERLVKFIAERHSFVNLRRSVLLIQHAVRSWMAQRRDTYCPDLVKAAIVIQKCFRGRVVRSIHNIENASLKDQEKGLSNREIEAATRIQIAWKNFVCRYLHKQTYAATKIQSHYRGWLLRRSFMKQKQKQAIIKIQSNFRRLKCWRAFQIAQKEFVCRSLQNQTFAATKIQSHYRGWLLRRSLIKQKQAIIKIQSNFRRLKCWRAFQNAQKEFFHRSLQNQTFAATKIQSHFRGWQLRRSFIKQKQAIIAIQSNSRRLKCLSALQQYKIAARSAIIIQSCVRGWIAQRKAWKHRRLIVVIQRHCRGWLVRKELLQQMDAVIKIQRAIRCVLCQKAFLFQKLAAIEIQRVIRGQISRNRLLGASSFHVATAGDCNCKKSDGFFQSFELKLVITSLMKLQRWWRGVLLLKLRTKSAITIQSHARGWIAKQKAHREKHCIVVIQRHCRGWFVRKELLLKRDSAIKIQRAIRCRICLKEFHLQKLAAIEIQRVIRGQVARSRLLGASFHAATAGDCNCKKSEGFFRSFELTILITSVLKLQRWWRDVLLLKLRTKSAIIIQSYARGWIARQKAYRERTSIVVIQSYWKGYVNRKESREQLLDLRLRMQKSAMNVDDSRRLINRLLSALSELLSMKSIRGILHNCETLDMATAHSLKCCEELVAAGAIGILLKLIWSASRSIPDQEVLKHALSTLRNLARYPHFTQVLIDTPRSVEIFLWELHRNKEEGYFIASQILKKICLNPNGLKAVHKFPALLKRLHNLVEELTRKTNIDKRNPRAVGARDNTDRRRLKEAAELLKLITNG